MMITQAAITCTLHSLLPFLFLLWLTHIAVKGIHVFSSIRNVCIVCNLNVRIVHAECGLVMVIQQLVFHLFFLQSVTFGHPSSVTSSLLFVSRLREEIRIECAISSATYLLTVGLVFFL